MNILCPASQWLQWCRCDGSWVKVKVKVNVKVNVKVKVKVKVNVKVNVKVKATRVADDDRMGNHAKASRRKH